jgi:hypothetical protein
MTEILLRVMRKIINEEIKTRSLTATNNAQGILIEHYFLGAGCG